MIFFSTVIFNKTIHIIGGGYGFTTSWEAFVIADSAEQANEKIKAYCTPKLKGGAQVERAYSAPAREQDLNKYIQSSLIN